MTTRIRKGVIVAAGYGSRFLPVTKTVPKELLPLINKPAVQFVVEEFAASGITEILIITSRRKKTLDDYFDREVELETELPEEKLARLPEFTGLQFYFVRQERMRGTVDALHLIRGFAGEDPFVVAYPDDVFFSRTPVSRQLIEAFTTYPGDKPVGCAVAVEDYGRRKVHRYGVVVPVRRADLKNQVVEFRALVEKPAGRPPSRSVAYGRYVFSSALFPALEAELERQQRENIDEITQSDAITRLFPANVLLAVHFEGVRRDLGQPEGFLTATIDYALDGGLRGAELRAFKAYLKSLTDAL